MLEEVLSEVVLEHEQVQLKGIDGSVFVLELDGFLPHAHEFPRFELSEEAEVLDVVEGVTLNEPLAHRHELDGSVALIEGQALTRDSVVLLVVLVTGLLVADRLKVIGVALVFAHQVCENGFFLAASVKEEFDVFIELTPLLGLRGLLGVVFAEVVDHDGLLDVHLGLLLGAIHCHFALRGLTGRFLKGRQCFRRQFSSELVQEEFAAGLLEVLLAH